MSITKMFPLFVLCAVILYPSSTTAEPILDVNGEPVQNGGSSYYMVPRIWALGGGVALDKIGNEHCPMSVVQQPSEVSNGIPLKISSMARSRFVPEGRVQISFAYGPKCGPTPPVWTLSRGPQGYLVKVTNAELADKNGYFVIEEGSTSSSQNDQFTYKLSFCYDSDECETIGIIDGHRGKRLLGVTNTPFEFVLVKAQSSSST
uniref:Antifungal protein n=1 Tax=Cullen corylifolium TaxID=429560 RepID=A0A076FN77_CULCO|nr:antifungal protein [Cullen corylifolium]